MTTFRTLSNADFEDLSKLFVVMHKECYGELSNPFLAIATLVEEVNTKQDFTAFGLFNDSNELIGISTGYAIENNCFYFSGFCVIIKNTINTKILVDNSLKTIHKNGYESWECDTHSKNMQSILVNKCGAKLKKVRLRGELKW